MLKTSIETISSELCTVIWRKPEYQNKLLGALDIPQKYEYELGLGSTHIATTLPALPEHPKLEDAALLYRYMAEGLRILMFIDDREYSFVGFSDGYMWGFDVNTEMEWINGAKIIGAVDADGNRVEVAIAA